jgi:hypothetical protein
MWWFLVIAAAWTALLSLVVFVQCAGPLGVALRMTRSPCGISVLFSSAVVALSWVIGTNFGVLYAAFLLVVITTVVIAVKSSDNRTPGYRMQWSLRQLLLIVTCIAVVLSTLAQQWPFRVRFALSRPALESLAVRVEQGDPTAKSGIAGLFYVRLTQTRGHDYICLWTDLNPTGYAGFVRCAPRQAAHLKNFVNLWSQTRMDYQWQFVVED